LTRTGAYLGALFELSTAYSSKGDHKAAMPLLMKILDMQRDNPNIYYNIACIYAKQNRADESIKWLIKAVQKGFINWNLMKADDDLINIRNEEGYKRIIQGK
jgi:protein O-mannosyl-transferase